jgi:hypothetical protein
MDDTYSFEYTQVGSNNFCPWLLLNVIGPNGRSIPIRGIVDSGADVTAMPYAWAAHLGYDMSKLTLVPVEPAAGSPVEAYRSTEQHCLATVEGIPDLSFRLDPFFVQKSNKFLWGQADFMATFDVLFMKSQNRFDLYPT